MSKTVFTKKGTELPLVNLKGKDYLMVAYRIQWMNEEVPNFDINTELVSVDDEQTIARAQVVLKNEQGNVVKSATATKRETRKDFSDHTEKAETAAIGRALAMLGYGTQFAIADLDEGQRLADSPLQAASRSSKPVSESKARQSVDPSNLLTEVARLVEQPLDSVSQQHALQAKPTSTFKKPRSNGAAKPEIVVPVESDDWQN